MKKVTKTILCLVVAISMCFSMGLVALADEASDVSLDDLTHAPREELEEESLQGKHMFGVVTVGDKGQIVIPVRARRIFGIKPGDQLMVLGEDGKGLALTDARLFMSVAEAYRNDK